MPETTPAPTHFQDAYAAGEPPWVIDEPQPAVVDLERRGGLVGSVLDVGCGTGEHTMLLARLGYDVLGVDAAPAAIARAGALADGRGVPARFEVVDVLHPEGLAGSDGRGSDGRGSDGRGFDTVLDSALFHIFAPADRATYADALAGLVAPGGRLVVLALAEGGSGFGPEITEDAVAATFTAPTWALESQEASSYRGRIPDEENAALFGLPVGAHDRAPTLSPDTQPRRAEPDTRRERTDPC